MGDFDRTEGVISNDPPRARARLPERGPHNPGTPVTPARMDTLHDPQGTQGSILWNPARGRHRTPTPETLFDPAKFPTARFYGDRLKRVVTDFNRLVVDGIVKKCPGAVRRAPTVHQKSITTAWN